MTIKDKAYYDALIIEQIEIANSANAEIVRLQQIANNVSEREDRIKDCRLLINKYDIAVGDLFDVPITTSAAKKTKKDTDAVIV